MGLSWPGQKAKKLEYSSVSDGQDSDSNLESSSEQAAWKRSRRSKRPWLSFYLAGTNFTIVVLLVVILARSAQNIAPPHPPRHGVPEFPIEFKTFHQDPLYMGRTSEEADAAWELLGGPDPPSNRFDHRGFIYLKGDDLPESQKVEETGEMIYGVSMLHQLHCLGGLRKMMWDLVYGRTDPASLLAESPDIPWNNQTFDALTHGLWHVAHCFDMVRQGLMCAADMSLEWPIQVDGGNVFVGWENPHQCKNWEAVTEFIEAHS